MCISRPYSDSIIINLFIPITVTLKSEKINGSSYRRYKLNTIVKEDFEFDSLTLEEYESDILEKIKEREAKELKEKEYLTQLKISRNKNKMKEIEASISLNDNVSLVSEIITKINSSSLDIENDKEIITAFNDFSKRVGIYIDACTQLSKIK